MSEVGKVVSEFSFHFEEYMSLIFFLSLTKYIVSAGLDLNQAKESWESSCA
jgi:hypothetical protein